MAVGDHYEIRVKGIMHGQNMLNVFHYQSTNEATDAEALAGAFAQQVLPEWVLAVSQDYQFQSVEAYSLNDPTDWHITPAVANGAIATNSMPAFAAASLSYRSQNRSYGVGGKRIAGVPEDVENGQYFSTSYEDKLNALLVALLNVLVDVATQLVELAIPVIIKRITMPPNPGPIESARITSTYRPRLGSQVSRKIARVQ